jgi:plastocyanin
MRTLRSLVVVVMVCAGAVSCSSSPKAVASCTPSGPTQTVDLKDFAFDPTCIGAASGAHLTLQNSGAAPHTFTINGTPVNQKVDPGSGAEVSFAGFAPGTYPVVCTIHPQMTGTLQIT